MANFNFNKVILGGRLTADPELKQTQSGIPVTTFSLAVNRRYSSGAQQPETDFFNITAWRQTAEFVTRYFKKGSSICVVGSVQNRTWTDNNNQKQYRTDFIADEVLFVDSKNDSQGADEYSPMSAKLPEGAKLEEISTDDSLPF